MYYIKFSLEYRLFKTKSGIFQLEKGIVLSSEIGDRCQYRFKILNSVHINLVLDGLEPLSSQFISQRKLFCFFIEKVNNNDSYF